MAVIIKIRPSTPANRLGTVPAFKQAWRRQKLGGNEGKGRGPNKDRAGQRAPAYEEDMWPSRPTKSLHRSMRLSNEARGVRDRIALLIQKFTLK